MKEKNERQKVSYAMLKLVMQYMEIEHKVQNFGTDIPIHNSEIHIISAVAQKSGIHIRGLAEQMGVASASISEAVSKLEKKGLLRKEISPTNQSRLSLFVTDRGKLAHEEHMKYHRILEDMTENELTEASDEQVAFITQFLINLSGRLARFEENI